MVCINVTTLGVAIFSDPAVIQVSVDIDRITVRITTRNTGSASGSCDIKVTVDGTPIGSIPSGTVNAGANFTIDYTITDLVPATTYNICATIL